MGLGKKREIQFEKSLFGISELLEVKGVYWAVHKWQIFLQHDYIRAHTSLFLGGVHKYFEIMYVVCDT